ncbi:hypothetical protein [Myceligenerans xiligouense]|uniref:Uncharacterized protein n=1 Tax=Myceligenerans xiligouense TaxID=253184 RepID=A0A3N4YLN7_9MICO|nr:hypothetical protein [Myceligenerans xiligouense]RPF20234.1 hypothetical protein EDD34_0813 [Myceligenerans xiligouense]
MLGRDERESSAHALLAARAQGWSTEPVELLDLGTTADTLATVASIDDLAAVVHLGHPEQPSPGLERALLEGAPSLIVTAAGSIEPQWVWVGAGGGSGGQVVVDEAGLRDCAVVLRGLGVHPRLVPTRTPVAERVALAGAGGSLVVERSRVPAGFTELPDSALLAERGPVWYGLLQARDIAPAFTEPAQVWLAFGPYDDHRGSLQPTLAVIADAGIDLQHLRSQASVTGPHVFFTSFSCPSSAVLSALVDELDTRGIAHRVLAVLPGAMFEPGPDQAAPQWAGEL